MHVRSIAILCLALFLSTNVFAQITVEPIQNDPITISEQELLQQQQLNRIEAKLNELATKQDFRADMQVALLQIEKNILENVFDRTDYLILMIAIMQVAIVVIVVAFYFYWKGQKRV